MIDIQIKINSVDEAIELVKKAESLHSDVDFTNGRVMVDAKSILGVLSADFSKPCKVFILAKMSDPGVCNFIDSIKENIISLKEVK